MSRPALDDLVAGVDLQDRALALVDYNAMTRRLVLRIHFDAAGASASDIRTLVFDGVFGLHCDPPAALAPLGEEAKGDIIRLDAKPRKGGEFEIAFVYARRGADGGAPTTQAASFHALDARWLG